MFKKILLYGLAILGIISIVSFVYIGLFMESETQAEIPEGVYYVEDEDPKRVYSSEDVVVNQGVIFGLTSLHRTFEIGVERTFENPGGPKLEIGYMVNNKVGIKEFEKLTVSPFQFRLYTMDGSERPLYRNNEGDYTWAEDGKTAEGVVNFSVSGEEEEYILEFESEAYLKDPKKISYRIKL
ncbi:hypothetical protein [Exiguobacterium sp. s28]|uniref:hypothetical protein n=1 Tax=Exiguobacterium sp. s28 TaxID=2751238 RepID=UPI001BEC63B7|nr:hypothetical protein [Exiguobacterium sp. s28]